MHVHCCGCCCEHVFVSLHFFVCVRAMRDPAAQVRQGLFCVVFLVCFARHFVWHSTPSIECRHCCCCGERGRAAPQRGERDKDFNITKICLKLLQEASWSGALGRLAGVLSRQGISR